jgi:hypothetical protein
VSNLSQVDEEALEESQSIFSLGSFVPLVFLFTKLIELLSSEPLHRVSIT